MSNAGREFRRDLADRFLGKHSQNPQLVELHFIVYRRKCGPIDIDKDKRGFFYAPQNNGVDSSFVSTATCLPNVFTKCISDGRHFLEVQKMIAARYASDCIEFCFGSQEQWELDSWSVIHDGLKLRMAADDEPRQRDYWQQWRDFEKTCTDAAAAYTNTIGGSKLINWLMHLFRTFPDHCVLQTRTELANATPNEHGEFLTNRIRGTGYMKLENLRALSARAILGDIQPLATAPEDSARDAEKGEGGKASADSEAALEDGPFGVDGFRVKGQVVNFHRANMQYRLIKSLWDFDTRKPTNPRPDEDIIQQVYEGDEVSGSAFRQLICDTRRRLESSKFPAKIETGNGVVRLVIV